MKNVKLCMVIYNIAVIAAIVFLLWFTGSFWSLFLLFALTTPFDTPEKNKVT